MKYKKIVIAVCVVCAILIGVSGVYALFTDKDVKTNEFTLGSNTIEIIEDFKPPTELLPGVTFTKDVSVKNTGDGECYVRIKAVFTNSDMEPFCDIDFNTSDFVYDDGYYYLVKPISNNEVSKSLFTTVHIKDKLENGQDVALSDLKDFDILVYAESYQARGFNDYKSAWDNFQANKPL